jgi:hypothetical protein
MVTSQQIVEIEDHIKGRITAKEIPLEITGRKLEDGWLTVVVVPTQAGIRASEYAEFMSEVERELREKGYDDVVLVPALVA